MSMHDFIFSKGRHRILRHLIFWLAWTIFATAVQLTNFKPGPIPIYDLMLYQLLRSITRLPAFILFSYVTVYFLVPAFLQKGKYLYFIICLPVFVIIVFWFNYLFVMSSTFNLQKIFIGEQLQVMPITGFIRFFFSYYSIVNFSGAIPACCLMLAIKYFKDWYIKQTEGEMLKQENKVAELQLLKAQIHPHFLFNTLNNIYSFTLTGSPQAASLVDKLSGMIDYITTEGAKTLVLVEKEIQLLKDYIGLEKVRYGDRLDMQVEIKGDYKNKMIAPLLMIPFVENCFKHGASVMRGEQWIKMSIEVNANRLEFHLSNSKPLQSSVLKNKRGIGLVNVQKRLQLLYPQKHFLQIQSTDETFSVHLQITLQEEVVLIRKEEFKPKLQPAFYE